MPQDSTIAERRATSGCRPVLYGLMLVVAGVCCGCRSTMDAMTLRRLSDESASIADIRGPQERQLLSAEWQNRKDQLQSSGMPLEGLAEFESAQSLYDQGEYRAAERAFSALARQRALVPSDVSVACGGGLRA